MVCHQENTDCRSGWSRRIIPKVPETHVGSDISLLISNLNTFLMCKTLQTNCILNRYIYIFLSLFCSAFFLSAGVSKASLKAVRLSVSLESDRSDPVREVPFFSWQITSEKRNLQQAAWRVQLSPGNSGFGNPGNLVWDSGKILSGESVLVPGHGAALLPANSYTWRVKVWSLEGEES